MAVFLLICGLLFVVTFYAVWQTLCRIRAERIIKDFRKKIVFDDSRQLHMYFSDHYLPNKIIFSTKEEFDAYVLAHFAEQIEKIKKGGHEE